MKKIYIFQISLLLDRPNLFLRNTSSLYSFRKVATDLLLLSSHRIYGSHVTINRYFNNYYPYHFLGKLIRLMIVNTLSNKLLPILGMGLYLEDHCSEIDPAKIYNKLTRPSKTKYEDGIRRTIQWYLDNREWWERIIFGEYQNIEEMTGIFHERQRRTV